MGSSSRNKGRAQAGAEKAPDPNLTMAGQPVAPPPATMALPGADARYYTDVNQLPQTGGLMRPPGMGAPGGPPPGAGLNFTMPPPPPAPNPQRNALSTLMNTFGRSSMPRGLGGTYRGGHS